MRRKNLGFDLIGLTGPARCGKDSAAKILVERYGFKQYSLASPIKKMLKAIDINCNDSEKEIALERFGGKTPRQLKQSLGTEWGRAISDSLWLRFLLQEYEWVKRENYPGLVVSDIRFSNECDFIRKHGVLIHISRPGVSHTNKHESDKAIPSKPGDFFICNDHTAAFLSKQINDYMNLRDGK